jgi:hypothetical protein
MNLGKYILFTLLILNSAFAYNQSKLDYEMELLKSEAFLDESSANTKSTTKTTKQRQRLSAAEESKIVDIESTYFNNKKEEKDTIQMMNAAPIRDDNSKKRDR